MAVFTFISQHRRLRTSKKPAVVHPAEHIFHRDWRRQNSPLSSFALPAVNSAAPSSIVLLSVHVSSGSRYYRTRSAPMYYCLPVLSCVTFTSHVLRILSIVWVMHNNIVIYSSQQYAYSAWCTLVYAYQLVLLLLDQYLLASRNTHTTSQLLLCILQFSQLYYQLEYCTSQQPVIVNLALCSCMHVWNTSKLK